MMSLSPKAPSVSASSSEVSLSEAQLELINYFASLSERLSLPRSAGQIYGLLFGQPDPVPFEEIVRALQISKGSASSSLKLLRGLKAIHPEHQLGDRRTFYTAETSVKNLVQAFLEDGVKSHLKESESQLATISALIPANSRSGDPDPLASLLHKRISSLQVWHRKARKLIPWIARLTLPKKGTDD